MTTEDRDAIVETTGELGDATVENQTATLNHLKSDRELVRILAGLCEGSCGCRHYMNVLCYVFQMVQAISIAVHQVLANVCPP